MITKLQPLVEAVEKTFSEDGTYQITNKLCDGEGGYCWFGAALHGVGVPDSILIDEENPHSLVRLSDLVDEHFGIRLSHYRFNLDDLYNVKDELVRWNDRLHRSWREINRRLRLRKNMNEIDGEEV